jgi:hypothetical protein
VQVGFVLVWGLGFGGLGPREPCETGADVMLERESPPSICPSSPTQQVAHTHTIRHLAAHAVPHVTRHTCKNHLPLLAAGFGLLRLVGCDCLAVESLMRQGRVGTTRTCGLRRKAFYVRRYREALHVHVATVDGQIPLIALTPPSACTLTKRVRT